MSDNSTLLDLLPDLNGGVFLQKADAAMQAAARSSVDFGEKGKAGRVVLEFTFERIGESSQVRMTHSVEITQPTPKGKRSESDKTETAVYVGREGKLTLMPDSQTRFEFDKGAQANG